MPDYSLAALKERTVREFKSEPTKKWYRSGNGKLVQEHIGVEYVTTIGAGHMPVDEWYQCMEEAVVREGKTPLLNAIMIRCKSLAWLRTDMDLRRYAIDCLSSGAYQQWKDFAHKEP